MKRTYDDFMSKIKDTFDDAVIVTEKSQLDVIPTGITSLDASIGVGGIPRAKITEIFGPESAGKTTIALMLCKYANQKGLKALYIDVENMIDYDYAKMLVGELDPNKLVILQPDTGEDALTMARVGVQSGEFGLIILDSVGALAPKEEKAKDIQDQQYASVPKLVTKFLRMEAYNIRVNNVAFVFINQVRDTIGSYVKSYSVPGGHALKHYSSVRIQLKKGQQIKADKEVIGINVAFTVIKNKLSAPYRSAVMPLMFGTGIDEMRDLISFSEMIGVVQRSGAFYKFDGQTLGKGMAETSEFIKNNPETLDKIKKMCYDIAVSDARETLDDYTDVESEDDFVDND